ncbi:hypothetical protein PHET_02211 [Paragonimus heterotremus]|uniref:Uncharacterized protein n=1 Tax=Paragonimus heterotremus TaxID=100268 RepID=A0A8J4SQQ4_9TREM|nr:hypothetical protein PHET_02211 [Paragonimus heterotremus]
MRATSRRFDRRFASGDTSSRHLDIQKMDGSFPKTSCTRADLCLHWKRHSDNRFLIPVEYLHFPDWFLNEYADMRFASLSKVHGIDVNGAPNINTCVFCNSLSLSISVSSTCHGV